MNDISEKLHTLKDKLGSAAFLVGQGGSDRQVHSDIIQSLVLVAEIEAKLFALDNNSTSTDVETREANKVRRRLRLWARRQNQINSRILNAFLALKRSGEDIVTETMLKSEFPGEQSFDSNFAQMKTIAEKNHGKIFEQHGEQISLWPPIAEDIAQYECVVLDGESIAEEGDMTIRAQARSWIISHHPEAASNKMRVSKYFPDREIWFFTFPTSYLNDSQTGNLNVMLQDERDMESFHFLKVPFSFFQENKEKLNVRSTGDKFDLHISGKKRNWLECERSSGVNFKQFEQENNHD